jgi:alkanesulfonate monooxygenase SsuD/methylene tetrahydromethanopterin reductase-like flavin-dependent oxidoreductase (luciferase family)
LGLIDETRFYYFHLHHYTGMPPHPEAYNSTWVDYPNSLFDPVEGHQQYGHHLRMLRLAEELGFDGVALNEHHNSFYSMTPSAGVMAGAVVASTSKVRILVAGTPINLTYPNRLAEEYAMLDVMSGGRMEFAFPLGTGMEYWANDGAINPARARARYKESLEILLKAWTEDGPIRHEGDFYSYRYLNPWPKPFQKPHPKLFIVGTGSKETVDLAVEYGLGYSINFSPIPTQLRTVAQFRERAAERGRTVTPDEVIIVAAVYVADTDEEAIREARPYVEKFWSWYHRVPPKFLLPPGYVSREEYLRRASDKALAHGTKASFEDMMAIQRLACGSPQTVADLLVKWVEEVQCSRVTIVLEHADMPEWLTVKNMTLFANEVIPRFRRSRTAEAAQPELVAG